MKIKWIGVDAVSADHPMNTIMRIWHPKTFAEANAKLMKDFGKDWDEMYPLDHYYQDMHLNLFSKTYRPCREPGRRYRHRQERALLHRLLPAEGDGS